MRVLRSPWPRLALFVVFLAAALVLTVTHGGDVVTTVRADVDGLGPLGVVVFVFVLVYAVATVALLPVSLLSAAAGVLFGPTVGVVAVWCGAMLGAVALFGQGPLLSRAAVEALVGGRLERFNRFLHRPRGIREGPQPPIGG